MDNIDRYGLAAQFSFGVQGSAFASMKTVRTELNSITQAVHHLNHALKNSDLTHTLKGMGAGARAGVRQASQQFQNMQHAARAATNQLQPLKAEFRALRAESRNIDFGNLHDDRQFKAATQQVHQYIDSLKALERQIQGDTAAERELKAQLRSQQQIAQNKVDTATAQRQAAMAAERQGKAQAIATGATVAALPLIGIGKESIKVLTGFDDQMSQVKAVSGATNEELAQIRQKAKDLGATTRFSASDAAAGFVLLGQAGYKTNQQLSAIDGTLNLAAAGSLELARATDITVSVLGGFQLGADQAIHAADVLALTANQANLDVGDLGESLKFAGPPAKAFGATLEQASAMLGVLSNAGIRGSEAGTALRAMFLRLAAPTGMAKTAMRDLGVSIADASGNIKPIDQILTDLQGSLSQLSAADQLKAIKTIFGTEATPAVQTLLSNIKGIQDLTAANLTAAGAAQKAAKIMEDNIGGSFRNFQSAAEGVLIEIGEVLAPVVIKVTNAISELMTKFIQLPQPIKTAIIVTGAIAAGLLTLIAIVATASAAFFGLQSAIATSKIAEVAMTRGLLPLTGFFQTAVSAFTGGGIVAGIQGLGAAIGAFITGPVGLAIAAFTTIFALAQILAPQFNVLGGVLSAIAAPIGFVFGLVKGIAEGILAAVKPLMTEMTPVGKALFPVGQIVSYIGQAITQATQTFTRFAGTGESAGKVIGQVIATFIVYPLRLVALAVQFGINAFTRYHETIQAVGQGIFNVIRSFILAPLTLVSTVAAAIARNLVTLFVGAAQLIQTAWLGFVNWFANLPLVGMALNNAQGLINALNHRPTIVIPLSWQGAVETIQGLLSGLQSFGESVGNFLGAVLDPGKLFGSLIDGLVAKIQGLVEAIQNSGLGKFFGNATEGLDTFLANLQQAQTPQLALATVSVASPPATVPAQAPPKKRSEVAVAPMPPTPPTGGAGGVAAQPLVIPVLPKLELPNIDALLAPLMQQASDQAKVTPPIAIPVLPTPPTADAIAPVIQQQNQQIRQGMQQTFSSIATEAQQGLGAAFTTISAEWSDRWNLLQRSGNTNLAVLFQPGIDELRGSLSTLRGEFLTFAGESAQAIANLDFAKAKAAAANFGGDLLGIVQHAIKSFGSLGLSAIAFGVVSLASMSPILLVLGGIALATIGIATNFLGIRSILIGIFKIVQGIFQVVDGLVRAIAAIVKTIYEIGRGLGQIFNGILPALTGDFSKIRQGFSTIFTAAQTGAFELQGAFNRVFGGVAQIIEGAGQTVRSVLQGIRQLAQGIGTAFQLGFKGAQLAIQGIAA
ncbi:MAG TPA: phage tail tape measure protein, partial [Allocoleopsis sp.]